MRSLIPALTLAPVLMLAACAAPQRAPVPAPPRAAPPPAPPAPPPLSADWRNWPVSAGTWTYRQDERGSIALFGMPGSDALFTLRCDKTRRRVYASRSGSVGANGGQMTVRTSFGDGNWAVRNTGGTPSYASADLDPADLWLDRIAFSRGRFAVEMAGQPPLALPAWPEFARVVEDCRG